MTQFPQLVVNILLTRLASDQRLPSSVHCSREFLMTKHHLSSNPRRQSVPESQAHRKHPVERAQEWGLHRRQKRLLWGIRAAFWPRPSGHKAPTDRRDPPLGGRQGEGAEALAAGESLGTKETAGRRPQEPICARQPLELRLQTCSSPPPPHPGPPARPPFCLLSPSVLAGPGPFPGSGYSVLIRAGGAGAGGCGGAACCARVGLPPPLSLALARRPAPSSGPERCPLDFAPRRALLLLRAGPCSVQAAAGKPEAKCSPDPRPTWLKSPSTSPSCRESRKDIARLLQEKELQEEKKRKKHFPESSGVSAYGDSYYYEDGDQPRSRRARELGSGSSRPCRLQHEEKTVKHRRERPRHPQENLGGPEEHCSSEKPPSPSSSGQVRDDPQVNTEPERKRCGHERLRRPPLPKISGEVFLSTESDDWEAHSSHRTRNWEKQFKQQDQLSPKTSRSAGLPCKEAVYRRDHGQGEHRERKRRPRTPPFSESEEQLPLRDTGMKPRVMKEAVSTPSRVTHRDQEWYDAEIARKLQEEEILATQVDMRAAQVAQDEEIARLLMAEEKKAYKKAREREKSSLDKRKHDPEWKPKTAKSAHSKSKESDEPHRSKNDRPARPPPPAMTDAEGLDYTPSGNQHNSTRHYSKSESSHKGFHYKP
ncbi:coiled-coil domain-containing protein 50 isoform X3 [Ovis aries]|nr:coiled-coil domain-containing protein 50 isoform X3 [Ovis aries]